MKRVIQFSKARYYFFAFSALLILIGVAGFIINHGLNLGVDFRAGISLQFQIAPASFSLQYTGTEQAQVSVPTGEQALTSPGDFLITITNPQSGLKQFYPYKFADYKTIKELADALVKVPGISMQPKGNMDVPPKAIVPPVGLAEITGKSQVINIEPASVPGARVDIGEVRAVLAPMGTAELQVAGNPAEQQFMARFEAPSEEKNFEITTRNRVTDLLGAKYGTDNILIISSDFVGQQMSQSLATQTIWLVLIAVILILIYMMLRFSPPIYAVAAVIGILHDALVMLAFDAVFRVQIDAGTIAAILTILGYSINDTIVNFDRARENVKLMRGSPFRTILDTSVSQTLGRTFITSGATLITVVALFILTTDTIRNFSLNMIVGIIEGTYSTFISAFIVIEWSRFRDKRRKSRDQEKFGVKTAKPKVEEIEAEEEEPGAEPQEVMQAESPADSKPAKTEVLEAREGPADQETATPVPDGQPAAPEQAETPPDKILSFPGGRNQGYRYQHKRHKRRHH
jgi:preprotein translocase subunit SecF